MYTERTDPILHFTPTTIGPDRRLVWTSFSHLVLRTCWTFCSPGGVRIRNIHYWSSHVSKDFKFISPSVMNILQLLQSQYHHLCNAISTCVLFPAIKVASLKFTMIKTSSHYFCLGLIFQDSHVPIKLSLKPTKHTPPSTPPPPTPDPTNIISSTTKK